MPFVKYDSWLTVEASKKLAAKLRKEGRYRRVKIGSYMTENGKRYSKVFVERR